jgi:hypothetical protein
VLLHGLPGIMQYLGSNSSYEKSIDSVGREADPIDPEVNLILAPALHVLYFEFHFHHNHGRLRENRTFHTTSASKKKILTAWPSTF